VRQFWSAVVRRRDRGPCERAGRHRPTLLNRDATRTSCIDKTKERLKTLFLPDASQAGRLPVSLV
jgi:hypothetical protein